MDARTFGFDAPIASRDDNRRQPRVPVVLRARLRNRTAAKFDIRVLDMSVTGFRAEAHYGLDPGDLVWVTLPGLQGLEATIAWRRKDVIGGRFSQPLHPAVLDHLIRDGARY
jgi:hypothetical protein